MKPQKDFSHITQIKYTYGLLISLIGDMVLFLHGILYDNDLEK